MDATIGCYAEQSVERAFESQSLPGWRDLVTVRSLVASVLFGTVFTFVAMRLQLAAGISPSLNMSAALLVFSFVKAWTAMLRRCGFASVRPFTRQENTVLQACIMACASCSFNGGFATYGIAMGKTMASRMATANDEKNILDMTTGQWMAFIFLTSFIGVFAIVPLRKIMIIDYKLMYPSGFVTGHLINSFHTPEGARAAKMQVSVLLRSFIASFLWSWVQWFFTAKKECGFKNFPMFGLQAFKNRFYFDFSASFVGLGMIVPSAVNLSLLLGSIISWGFMWPFIETKKGIWYTEKTQNDLKGMNGYRVLVGSAVILTDGIFHFCVIVVRAMFDVYINYRNNDVPLKHQTTRYSKTSFSATHPLLGYDDRRRTKMFLKDQIPNSIAVSGYLILGAITVYSIPRLFPQLKYYHILLVYLLAPVFAFCNSYGSGLTDWSLSSTYGKIVILVVSLWVGEPAGGVVAGLVACGTMMGVVATAADLMHDFRSGYLTLTSPRSMFVSQLAGTVLGCFITPVIFHGFVVTSKQSGQAIGMVGSTFSAPMAQVYRATAVTGFMSKHFLPRHCISLCVAFAIITIIVNAVKLIAQRKNWTIAAYLPVMMAFAVPMFVGPYIAVDMCLGSLVLFLWKKKDEAQLEVLGPVVSAGLICGDGIWQLPAAILALFNVTPPICMKFVSADVNKRLEEYLMAVGFKY